MSVNKLYLFIIYSVIFTFGFTVLSVNAIRCHQCNSHFDPECTTLQLPKAMKTDDKFLKECNGNYGDMEPFCRKTAYFIEFTNEHRVIRSCGWLKDTSIHGENKNGDICINADNEGFKEVICNCHIDGCNSSPKTSIQLIGFKLFSLISFILYFYI